MKEDCIYWYYIYSTNALTATILTTIVLGGSRLMLSECYQGGENPKGNGLCCV